MSAGRAPGVRAIADALAIRSWALRALHPDERADAGPSPAASAGAWRLFLDAEGCAAPLSAAAGAFMAPGPIADALLVDATVEAQRALAARRAAAEIGAAAREAGLRLVLLKGAVECIEAGLTLRLTDLDLLVEPARFGDALALLAALGYAADSPDLPDAMGTCNVNLAAPRGGIQLELHWTTRRDLAPLPAATWDALVPLRRAGGLYALAPVAHAWHVLTHGVLDHPDQQGRIRDAIVLARALARTDADGRAALAQRARRHRCASALTRALDLASSLAGWRESMPDSFRAEVAIAYALRGAMASALPRPMVRQAALAALLGAGAGAPGRAALRQSLRLHDVDHTTAARVLGPLPLPARRLGGRAVRLALYALHLVPATPVLARAAAARLWRAVAVRSSGRSSPRHSAPVPPAEHA